MRTSRENDVYLPGFRLPPNVQVFDEFARALEGAAVVLGVMPSHVARQVYTAMLPYLDPSAVLVSATKGLENGSLLRMSEVIREVVGARFDPTVVVISGP